MLAVSFETDSPRHRHAEMFTSYVKVFHTGRK